MLVTRAGLVEPRAMQQQRRGAERGGSRQPARPSSENIHIFPERLLQCLIQIAFPEIESSSSQWPDTNRDWHRLHNLGARPEGPTLLVLCQQTIKDKTEVARPQRAGLGSSRKGSKHEFRIFLRGRRGYQAGTHLPGAVGASRRC